MEEQNKKVKKNKANALHLFSHSGDSMHMKVKEKKRTKKKKDNCDDVESTLIQSEDRNEKNGAGVHTSHIKVDDQKKINIDLDKNGKEHKKVRKKDKKISKDGELVDIKEVSNEKAGVGERNRGRRHDDGKDFECDARLEAREDRKKRHKKNQKKDGINSVSTLAEIFADRNLGSDKTVKDRSCSEKSDIAKINSGEEVGRKEKKKKAKKDKEVSNVEGEENAADEEKLGKAREHNDENTLKNDVKKVKKKRKKMDCEMEVCVTAMGGEKKEKRNKRKLGKDGLEETVHVMEEGSKRKKGAKSIKDSSDGTDDKGASVNKMSVDTGTANLSETPKSKGTSKKVRFSTHVEVFPSSDDLPSSKKLKQGEWFSLEEDDIIKKAVFDYIHEHGLGEDGLDKVLNAKLHPEVRHCWREIALALPWRPKKSVSYRGHLIFQRAEKRGYTAEEFEIIRRFHKSMGSNWKMLADAVGKHRIHLKDAFRRFKLPNQKKGPWSQEEYQSLFDLVSIDLQMKATEEKKSKHGMLRDNIAWEAISEKLATRISKACCQKWYNQLTSPLVVENKWADTDDFHLLDALFSLDACCMEDVDWDDLLEHRSGDLCRKRWTQMARHIGDHRKKSFAEQVEVLLQRYRPELLEAREEYARRPAVDEVK